jgi:hypothetical protein
MSTSIGSRFRPLEVKALPAGDRAWLRCPQCRGGRLALGPAEVFTRDPGAKRVQITRIEGGIAGQTWRHQALSANPSPQRHAITIEVWCHDCEERFQLAILAHQDGIGVLWREPERTTFD